MRNLFKKLNAVLLAVSAFLFTSMAYAAEGDNMFQPIIDKINVQNVITGILGVAGLVILISVSVMGVNKLRSMIR